MTTELNLADIRIDPLVAMQLPAAVAHRRQMLPFATDADVVLVACANPDDYAGLQAVERALRQPVRAERACPQSLKNALLRVYGGATHTSAQRTSSVDLRTATDLEPDTAVRLGNELFHAALLRLASDIHIDPDPNGVNVRFRVDGVLESYRQLPLNIHAALLSRLKVLCGMDIAEKRAPQDGGFRYMAGEGGRAVDVRAATLPTKHGERMSLRLLALHAESVTLEQLGMSELDLAAFGRAIAQPHGLILLTGPTGSGKSTTLYAALRRLIAHENLNVITLEDPIEYDIPGVAQVEIDAVDKVNFNKALRSVLRHDPDVIMIGEIRDQQTAEIALQAALTGHLVFSTLHTNSTVGVVTRLADMGIERYLIAASLRLVVAQRLVRKLCVRCRRATSLSITAAAALGHSSASGTPSWEPVGCPYCGKQGYHGRLGLFEVLEVDQSLARMIAEHAEEPMMLDMLQQRHQRTLRDDARSKLEAAQTSFQEICNAVITE